MASNLESNSQKRICKEISTDDLKIKVEFEDQEMKIKTEVKEENFGEHVQHGMEIVEKFLNESETQLQAGKNLIKVEFEDLQKSTKSEFKAEIFDTRIQFFKEDFEEDIQLGMEIVEKFLNESETQVQEGKNLIKVELKDMEKSTKSEFQTEIKPKTEEKKEDFEEHVQHGMEIVEKFLNESETQLQEFRDPL